MFKNVGIKINNKLIKETENISNHMNKEASKIPKNL